MKMKYKFSSEDYEAIKTAREKNRDKQTERRLQVLEMRCEGKTHKEISEKTGFHRSHISNLIRLYFENGLNAITKKQYPGNRRNMSFAEEEELLAPFKEQAERGELVEVDALEAAYRGAVCHSIGSEQMYYVRHRQG